MAANPKKVLIVSYYWFPFAGVGTYRISRFVKYLKKAGWEVVVLTAQKAAAGHTEHDIDHIFDDIKVYRSKIIEPIHLLNTGNKKGARSMNASIFYGREQSLLSRLAVWIRLNLMVPDAKFTWKWFAVRLGKKIIKKENPDIILSTSPPPTTSLIAKELARWSNLPWIADFRDPWTNIYYYHDFPQSAPARFWNKRLEKSVLERADALTIVNHGFFPGHNYEDKTTKITNGFDRDDLPVSQITDQKKKFHIRYFGSLKRNQNPDGFIEAMKLLNSNHPEVAEKLVFELYGNVDPVVQHNIETASGSIQTKFDGFIPHSEMMRLVVSSDLLLFVIGKSESSKFVLSTKVFEYMAAQRPVLGLGPVDGAASELISETGIGKFFSQRQSAEITEYILDIFHTEKDPANLKRNEEAIAGYDFKSLTNRLESIMKSLIES